MTDTCEGIFVYDEIWSWCDTWYNFRPQVAALIDTGLVDGPLNPVYQFGDCAETIEFCYDSRDMCEPYAWPGGYTLLYQLEIQGRFHNREPVCCAACASKAKRAARLKLGDFGGNYVDRLVKVHWSTYDEGSPLECDGFEVGNGCEDDAVLESSCGDPDAEDEEEGRENVSVKKPRGRKKS